MPARRGIHQARLQSGRRSSPLEQRCGLPSDAIAALGCGRALLLVLVFWLFAAARVLAATGCNLSADAGSDQLNVCGSTATLTASVPEGGNGLWTHVDYPTPGAYLTFQYDSADLMRGLGNPHATITASDPGRYKLQWVVFQGGCIATNFVTITFGTQASATIEYPGSPYCPTGTALVLQNGTAGGTYSASPAGLALDSGTGTINLGTSQPGTYRVTYTYTSGCTNNASAQLTISSTLPAASITYSGSPYCPTGLAVVERAGTPGGTYSATPEGLVFDPSTGSINLGLSQPGPYTLNYSFGSAGCRNSTSTNIFIKTPPPAKIDYLESPYCSVGLATVTRTGTPGGTFSSGPGLSIDAGSGTIDLSASSPGEYRVQYTFSGGGCDNTVSTTLKITPALPPATIRYPGTPYCSGGTAPVDLTGPTGGTYSASPAGLAIDPTSGLITLNASTPGDFIVTYTVAGGACGGNAKTSVTVGSLPSATISYGSSTLCGKGFAAVTRTGPPGGTYQSGPGLNIDPRTGTINLGSSTPSNYRVSYTIGSGACTNAATTDLTIIPALEAASINYPSSPYCSAGTASVVLTGPIGGRYSSTPGLSVDPTSGAINVAASTPGSYAVFYDYGNGSCAGRASATVTVGLTPSATIHYASSTWCGSGTAAVILNGPSGGTFNSGPGLDLDPGTGAIDLGASIPGNYRISYAIASGACTNTASVDLTIAAAPETATISYPLGPYCSGGTAKVFQSGPTGGKYSSSQSLAIDPNTGAIDVGASAPGTYPVFYDYGSGNCTARAAATVTVGALPPATIAYASANLCSSGFAAVTRTGLPGGTYNSGPGLTLDPVTGTINLGASAVGSYQVTYTVGNGACTNSASVNLTIAEPASANIRYDGSPFCPNGFGTVTHSGTLGGIYSASPNGLILDGGSGAVNLEASTPGNYTVTYKYSSGNCDGFAIAGVTVQPRPSATISYPGSPYCGKGVASVLQFGVQSAAYSATPNGLSLDPGSGAINLDTSVGGTYTVTCTYQTGSCVNQAVTTVTVQSASSATISYPGGPFCGAGFVTVTKTGVGGGQYVSTRGLAIDANTGSIDLGASTPNNYVVVYALDGPCGGVATTTVTVKPSVPGFIDYPRNPYCAQGTAEVTLLLAPTGGRYVSTDGLVIDHDTGAINLGASTPGDYRVDYLLDVGGCTNRISTSVTIQGMPSATIAYPNASFCGASIALVQRTGATNGIFLSTPPGLAVDGASGTIDVGASSPGKYTVRYEFGTAACLASTTTEVTIGGPSNIQIAGSQAVCNGQSTTLTASGGVNYLWSTGATSPAITVSPLADTDYSVTVTSADGCSNSKTVTVTVNPPPIASISGNQTICAGQSTVLTATGGVSYLWNTGETNAAITVSPVVTTNYTVTVTGTGGCPDSKGVTVSVIPRPIATISGRPSICVGESTTLTASGGVAYLWSTGETNAVITVSPVVTTSYTLTVTSASGCTGSATALLKVNPRTTAQIAGNLSTCAGQSTTLTASGGGTYRWSTGETTAVITVNPTATTNYTVTVTSADGCTDSRSVTVTVVPQPTASITPLGPVTFCLGSSVTLDGGPGFTSYLWSNGATNRTINVTNNITLTVRVSDASGCMSPSSSPVTVAVIALPSAGAGSDQANVCGLTTTLSGNIPAIGTGAWSQMSGPGNVSFSDLSAPNAVATANRAGTYGLRWTVTNGACSAFDEVSITFLPISNGGSISSSQSICSGAAPTSLVLTGAVGNVVGWEKSTDALFSAPVAIASASATLSSSIIGPLSVSTWFRAIVQSGSCSSATSLVAQVTVNDAVTIIGQPTNAVACAGQPVTFTVGAKGAGPLQYQWRKDGKDIPGARSDSFALARILVADAGNYDVLVSGACGSLSSAPATLVVNTSLPVIDQCVGDRSLVATNCQATVPDLTKEITAHDDCTPPNLLSVTQSPAPGSLIGSGQTVVTLTVANQAGATATCQAKLTVTGSVPTLSISDAAVLEGNSGITNATFTVTLSQPACSPVSVQFATADGTAVRAGTESFLDPTLSISGNQVIISWPAALQGYSLQSKAQVGGTTWLDVPQSPTLQNGEYLLTQSLSGPAQFYRLHRAGIVDSAPALAASDYTPKIGTLTFAPGETQKTVSVSVNGDTLYEPDEIFVVNLSTPINATIVRDQGIGTIRNDDAPPTLSVDDVRIIEGNSGTTTAVFTVRLSAPSGLDVAVNFATADGTALAQRDYEPVQGTLHFAPEIDAPATVGTTGLAPMPGLSISRLAGRVLVSWPATALNAQLQVCDSVDNTRAWQAVAATPVLNAGRYQVELPAGGKYQFYRLARTGVAPGETIKTVSVLVNGDTLLEPDETFFINLSAPVNATVDRGRGIGTIVNDDVPPVLTINDVTVNEGNIGTTAAVFTVTLTGSTTFPVTVNYATADGTGKAGVDYQSANGSLTFNPGDTAKSVTVAVIGNTIKQSDRNFLVNLSAATQATIGDGQGTGTIKDDDTAPVLSINDVTVNEGNSGTTSATFTVTLTGSTTLPVTVNYATADATGKAGVDYQSTTGSLTFNPGETAKSITAVVIGNTIKQSDRTFLVNLSAATQATIGDAQGTGTIKDDDTAPVLSINDVTVNEGNIGTTAAVFTVSLTGSTSFPVTVNYATADGTGKVGVDYQSANGSLTFNAGETTKSVTVAVIGNTVKQSDRTFLVNLSTATQATIGDVQGAGTIKDDDAAPVLSINDVTVNEGNSGTTPAVFTVTLTGSTTFPVTVNYATADGTGRVGVDYQPANGSLTFNPGENTKSITVVVIGNTVKQSDRTFLVNLSAASQATIGDGQAVGTIKDDDSAPVLSINDVTVNEGNSGTIPAVFTVTLTGSTTFPVTVNYATADGTGKAGVDFQTASGTLTFAPGETSKSVTVQVIGNTVKQSDRTFLVNLSAATQATIGDGQGIGTIKDDDGPNLPPTVRITSPENNATFFPGSDIVLTADAADPGGTIVRVDLYAGTALIGTATQAPYTVTWTNVTTAGDYSLTARAIDDQGATGISASVGIHVKNEAADVAIIRNSDDSEIAALEKYLFDLGLTSSVFGHETASFEALRNFKLIIWDDLGKATNGLANKDVDVFQRAYNIQIPIYFIGERLASSTANLTEPYRSQWTQLTHLQPATTQGGNGTIDILTDVGHPVINGRFGFVVDFAYPAEVDVTSAVGANPYLLAKSGNADVLVAYEDSGSGVRTVSQDFLVVDGTSNADSISERQRLFYNSVWWLLHKPLCGLTDLVIGESASADPAQTGEALTYTLTVQRTGECEGTGVIVTDVLPAGVKFVSADTPQGTWSETDGVVTFHLGALEEVFLQLTVTVIPTQPGSISNTVRIRGNESEQSVNNNTAILNGQVQGAPVSPQSKIPNVASQTSLAVRRTPEGLVLIEGRSHLGAALMLESSADMVHWTLRTKVAAGAPLTRFTVWPEGGATFYRLRMAVPTTQ